MLQKIWLTVTLKGHFLTTLGELIVAQHTLCTSYLCSSVQSCLAKRPPPENPDRNVMQLLFLAIKRAQRRSITDYRPAAQIRIERGEMSLEVLQWHFCLETRKTVAVMEITRTGLTTTLFYSLLQSRSHAWHCYRHRCRRANTPVKVWRQPDASKLLEIYNVRRLQRSKIRATNSSPISVKQKTTKIVKFSQLLEVSQ